MMIKGFIAFCLLVAVTTYLGMKVVEFFGKVENDAESEGYGMTNEEVTEIDFIQPKKIVGKLISVNVLDKIRAEIEEMKLDVDLDIGNEMIYNNAIKDVLQIIDKYKAESEEV